MAVDPARIRDVPLFAGLSDDERAVVAEKMNERQVAEGRRLSTEGGSGYFFFVIESGSATVSHGDTVVATLGPGDFLGEAAILETTRRTADVTAATDMTVLEMFGADFAMLNAHSPAVKAAIDKVMAERLARPS
jgi:cAMP-dependent protein kinase regulator/CRP/FNR family cyclic AMP-dependent transcriptional regulator/cGMP-dependent protein kinase 2